MSIQENSVAAFQQQDVDIIRNSKPNGEVGGEKSLDRNNSVFNRKELIKKEYNRIMDQRLPNILSLMNHDKYNLASVSGIPAESTAHQELI